MQEIKKHIIIDDKADCSGCNACEQKCPVDCISMVDDGYGFAYPIIDEEICINCSLCIKHCHEISFNSKISQDYTQKAFALKSKDFMDSINSASGGVAYLLSKRIIENGGYVCACAFDENIEAKHIVVDNLNDLVKLQGSKYVESDVGDSYKKVEKLLKDKKTVLFIGVGCQVAGLKQYLKKDYPNLITADIVCHGVPSAKLFKKYKEWLENKYKSKIISYSFRNKDIGGWGSFIAKVIFENGMVKYLPANLDPYYHSFLKGSTYRDVCYSCKYANLNRPGDLTLADFWGIENIDKGFFTKDGVSLVITNNAKGEESLLKLEKLYIQEHSITKAVKYQLNLNTPTQKTHVRDLVYKALKEDKSFEMIADRFLMSKKEFLIAITKMWVKKILPQNFIHTIQKMRQK